MEKTRVLLASLRAEAEEEEEAALEREVQKVGGAASTREVKVKVVVDRRDRSLVVGTLKCLLSLCVVCLLMTAFLRCEQ